MKQCRAILKQSNPDPNTIKFCFARFLQLDMNSVEDQQIFTVIQKMII